MSPGEIFVSSLAAPLAHTLPPHHTRIQTRADMLLNSGAPSLKKTCCIANVTPDRATVSSLLSLLETKVNEAVDHFHTQIELGHNYQQQKPSELRTKFLPEFPKPGKCEILRKTFLETSDNTPLNWILFSGTSELPCTSFRLYFVEHVSVVLFPRYRKDLLDMFKGKHRQQRKKIDLKSITFKSFHQVSRLVDLHAEE